mmetsp:Transcript_5212/g.8604  ORF Transcript_5212/g.8604 Transcript_5212/m.8604 type:complete len:257 (+) Transcript_5212:1670-2440(+)
MLIRLTLTLTLILILIMLRNGARFMMRTFLLASALPLPLLLLLRVLVFESGAAASPPTTKRHQRHRNEQNSANHDARYERRLGQTPQYCRRRCSTRLHRRHGSIQTRQLNQNRMCLCAACTRFDPHARSDIHNLASHVALKIATRLIGIVIDPRVLVATRINHQERRQISRGKYVIIAHLIVQFVHILKREIARIHIDMGTLQQLIVAHRLYVLLFDPIFAVHDIIECITYSVSATAIEPSLAACNQQQGMGTPIH